MYRRGVRNLAANVRSATILQICVHRLSAVINRDKEEKKKSEVSGLSLCIKLLWHIQIKIPNTLTFILNIHRLILKWEKPKRAIVRSYNTWCILQSNIIKLSNPSTQQISFQNIWHESRIINTKLFLIPYCLLV